MTAEEEANPEKEPPIGFKRHLLDYFINDPKKLEEVAKMVDGYKQRGVNMESFWWIDPTLHPLSREDLAGILNDSTFNLDLDTKREYLEKYIDFLSHYSSSK